jgi:hypothetical protein
MGADEEGTLARLKALRRELADPKIKEHRAVRDGAMTVIALMISLT